MKDVQVNEKRFPIYADLSDKSVKILNTLQQNDVLENGLKKSQCKKGKYIDEALLLMAERKGIKFE